MFFILSAGPTGRPCPLVLFAGLHGFCMSGVCLPGGEEVGVGAACVFRMGCGKEQRFRYLLSHFLTRRARQVCSVQRSWPAPEGPACPKGQVVEGVSGRQPTQETSSCEDRPFPTLVVSLGRSLDGNRKGAGLLFPLKGAPGQAGLGWGRSTATLSGVRPPAPALVV